jgi:heat-inducible transcriptional repressor
VVTAATTEAARVRSVQLVALSEQSVMAVAVLSNGTVESVTFERPPEVSDAVINGATALLSHHAVGSSLARLGHVPTGSDDPISRLARRALDELSARATHPDEHLYVGGTASVASAFEAVEVVRNVLATLEQEYVVVSLLRDMLDRGAAVAIGSEHGVEQLAACSVVVAPYIVEGEAVGTVGLLGPTRMNYPQALVAVDVVSQRLSERLSDG